MNRPNPYKVPDGYFDNLNQRITTRVKRIETGEDSVDAPTVGWGEAWRRLVGFAAAFALLVGFGWGVVFLATDKEQVAQTVPDVAIMDTARFLWVMSEDDVIEIVDHKQNRNNIMAQAAVEYIAFFGEADDINFIYYD